MTPSESGTPGESGRRAQQSKDERPGIYPGWRSNLSAVRSLEEENRRLRGENEQLKRELDKNRLESLRNAERLRNERRLRVQAEKVWRQNASWFFRWIDNAAFGLACFSGDGIAVQGNRAVLELLGFSREEFLGKSVDEIVADEDVARRVLEASERGTVFEQQPCHLRTKSGELKPVLLTGQASIENGSGLCCHVHPIPRVEKREKVFDSHLIFRQVAENMREIFWVTNLDKSVMYFVSPAVEEVCGISEERLYRNPSAFLEVVHPEDRERVIRALPSQKDGTFREEYRLVFPDGSIRWVRDRAFPIRNKAGEVYRLAGIVEDITALKGAELALAARVRQQKALADLGRAAMEKKGLQEVFEETVETVARLLNVDFCKILEHREESGDFLMRAGVGWPKEMVGRARIFAGEISQAGFAMKAEFPVIVDNLMTERRFEGATLLWNWGIRSGATVRIGPRSHPFGVLGVHSQTPRMFSHDDVSFLEAAANLLWATVERVAAEEQQENLSLQLLHERQRLNDILTTAPGVVWEMLWDKETKEIKVTFVSDHVEEVTGFPRRIWLGNMDFLKKRLHPEDRDAVFENLRRGLEKGEMTPNTRFRLFRADGRMVWLESRKKIFYDRAGNRAGLRGVLLDVTSQVEAEEELRVAETRFRRFMDHTPVIAFIKDSKGRYVYGNKAFQEMVSQMRIDWLNRTDEEIFPPSIANWFQTQDRRALEERRTIQTVEMTLDGDGSPRYWTVFKFPLTNGREENCVGAVGVDITERRRLEQEILQISDREQRRMGQDLHDGLCQHLLGLALMTAALADRAERQESPHGKEIREISALLYDAVALARGLMRGLHLVNLEGGGLSSALEEFARTTGRLFGKKCEFRLERPFTVNDRDLATHLFRISQEATNNAIKHGNAETVRIIAGEDKGGLTIAVEDDGTGLPDPIPSTGMGLQTMRYRAELIGATFSLENKKEGGTRMLCHLPPRPEIEFE